MKNFNLDKEKIGKFAKKTCEFAIYGVATILSYVSVKDTLDVIRYSGIVDYGDAVHAIMNSDMLSSYKTKAVEILPKDGNSDLYKAIIGVVRSDMLSSNKVKSIENICEK